MPLSRNLFKQGELVSMEMNKKIETNHTPKIIKKKNISLNSSEIAGDNLTSVVKLKKLEQQFHEVQEAKAEAFKREAEAEKQQLKTQLEEELAEKKADFYKELAELKRETLLKAEKEGEKLKQKAIVEGLQEGKVQGQKEGFTTGLAQGEEEARFLKENAHQLLTSSKKAVFDYQVEKQQEIIQLAVAMAEKIIQKEISLSEDDLFMLLEPFINQLNTVDNFVTVYVQKEKIPLFQEKLEELKSVQPTLKYVVLVDDELETNGCVMETEYEVIDLQIGKQLKAIITALNEVEVNDTI